jgi:hypothetical protein
MGKERPREKFVELDALRPITDDLHWQSVSRTPRSKQAPTLHRRSSVLVVRRHPGLLECGLDRVQPSGDPRMGAVHSAPYWRSIIRTDVPITRASSKTVTPAASAFEANVARRS